MALGNGNGVHSRQEIRFPLRKIDKEEDVGGRGEGEGSGQAVPKIVTLICRDLPRPKPRLPLFFF